MARPRKPTEILELSGAFDKDPQRKRPVGPKSGLEIGDPPDGMEPDEAACWREFLANAPAGVLTSGDRWILEKACCLMAKSRRVELSAGEFGHLRGCLVELGATPASRSKISAPPSKEPEAANPWDVPAVAAGIVPQGVRQ